MSEKSDRKRKRVVVMGGGTGTHTVLKGLKQYADRLQIIAIVTMADSGGSTGRLRDEFGCLPVGDARMALAALAHTDDEHGELLRELFMHRFNKGEGLNGHNVGNLFLVALTEILGSEHKAIKAATEILRVDGTVLPITTDPTHLVATYDDGVVTQGEHVIDDPKPNRYKHRIASLTLTKRAQITQEAREAITEADLIVLGPGDLYTSLIANLVVGGVKLELIEAKAKLVYVANLMTKAGHTLGMTLTEHVSEISRYAGRAPDTVLYNTTPFPRYLLKKYEASLDCPVVCDPTNTNYIGQDLLAREEVKTRRGDTLKRSLIRHDSEKLSRAIMNML